MARGNTNADIGRELHISEATVKTHLLRAFNKLGVSDRTRSVGDGSRAAEPIALPSGANTQNVTNSPG